MTLAPVEVSDAPDAWPASVRRPDFFLVGAPKSGTTAMAAYLGAHPQVFMPLRKDVHHFGRDLERRPNEMFVLDEAHYARLYAGAGSALRLGDASTGYLYSQTAAAEIRAFNPEARILIMLRNPVDVMFSSHSHLVWLGYEDIEDFEAALEAEPDRIAGRRIPASCMLPASLRHRDTVRFAEQVERYLDVFGREAVEIVLYDDFKRDTRGTYGRVLEFLDVEPHAPESFDVVNPNKYARSRAVARWLQAPPAPYRWLRGRLSDDVGYVLWLRLLRLNTRIAARPPMPEALRRRLLEEFAPEIDRLAAVTGRDLEAWKEGAAAGDPAAGG